MKIVQVCDMGHSWSPPGYQKLGLPPICMCRLVWKTLNMVTEIFLWRKHMATAVCIWPITTYILHCSAHVRLPFCNTVKCFHLFAGNMPCFWLIWLLGSSSALNNFSVLWFSFRENTDCFTVWGYIMMAQKGHYIGEWIFGWDFRWSSLQYRSLMASFAILHFK